MPNLVIKNFPDTLRRRLKADARKHSRSLDGEVLDLLEKGLFIRSRAEATERPSGQPFLLTRRWLDHAKRQGRAVRLEEFLSRRK